MPDRARLVALGLAAVKLVVHLLTLRPYGIFRDELYYLACSRHLALGYVDQPPLSIAVLGGWTAVFGDSVEALRVPPALAGAATVYLAGRIAIELGGGALAVLLAGAAALSAPLLLGFNHYYSMNSFDILLWTAAALLVLRALQGGGIGPWLWLGVVLGLGLENKLSVLWLGAGLGVGLAATSARRSLATPGPWVAVAIAVGLFLPQVGWQLAHGWPTLEFMRNALDHKYVRQSPVGFLVEATMSMGPATLLVWLPGLVFGLARPGRARVLGVAFVVVLAVLIAVRAKAEYLAAGFPMMFAAGGVAWERLLAGRRGGRLVAAGLVTAIVGLGAVAAPLALPVLSEAGFVAYQAALGRRPVSSEKKDLADLPQFYADMHGWRELAALVDQAVATLGPDERPGAVVWVWGNYGVAAAIEQFGRGVPHVACGHNSYWTWGPGHGDGRAVVVVGGRREEVARHFRAVVQTGTFECALCMPYENHKPIYVGRGLLVPLADLWPDEKFYE
jgi:hypothetical protein